MSKLIVEIEMPKRCIECGVRLKCKRYVCGLQQDIAEDLKPLIGDKDCLIKGVLPDEHGDLIDRQKALFEMCEGLAPKGYRAWAKRYLKSEKINPTVIAAERKDDENN